MINNRYVHLREYIANGPIAKENFALQTKPLPELKEDQILIHPLVLGVEPSMRGRMNGLKNYFFPPYELDEPLQSFGVGRVIKSKLSGFKEGDIVHGFMDWAEYYIWDHSLTQLGLSMDILDPDVKNYSQEIGIYGINGLTAYFGVLEIAQPRQGDTMVISGAAGGVGSIAGQIAKLQGATVIGVTGSDEKGKELVEKLRFDAYLNYKSPTFKEDLLKLVPNGPDIYYDNVGGEISQIIMNIMRRPAKVVECGQISTYHDPDGGWKIDIRPIHRNGLRLEGFQPLLFKEDMPRARTQLIQWVESGQLIPIDTEYKGLESGPAALEDLFKGKNLGKMFISTEIENN